MKHAKKKIVVAISGYFQVLHAGHIDYIRSARKYGNYLIVIINSDKQANLKKTTPCVINEKDRAYIISNIKGVNEVVISIDEDKTVSKTLEMIKPDIFCNGGDRTSLTSELKEVEVCNKMGIKIIYTGETKRDSSYNILQRAHQIFCNK